MSDDKPSLKERVEQFSMLQLPGQPMAMHMGTSYLVNDLWRRVQELEADSRLLDVLLDPEGPFVVLTPDDQDEQGKVTGREVHTRDEIDEVLGEHEAVPVAEPDGDPPSYLERFTRRALGE